jgi:hypothetical protein
MIWPSCVRQSGGEPGVGGCQALRPVIFMPGAAAKAGDDICDAIASPPSPVCRRNARREFLIAMMQ